MDMEAQYRALYDAIDKAVAGDSGPLKALVASGALTDYSAASRAAEGAASDQQDGYLDAAFDAISAYVGQGAITWSLIEELEALYKPTIIER